ncbi:MAG TPA: GNAT family N-acetyltransferase [candidate division Zixibacteria bacterium]|nr:GNAT family N-acetyltransferase [candidate division Zixibacteria bacterium]
MSNCQIINVTSDNLDDLNKLCVPKDKWEDAIFQEGFKLKKECMRYQLKKFGEIAKLAIINGAPVGMIQFLPNVKEQTIEIQCIFVPDEKHQRKGIAKALFHNLLESMKQPKVYFNHNTPLAFTTFAFEIPEQYPQHEFYQKMGFKRINDDDDDDDPYSLYYPLKKDYIYQSKISEKDFQALPENKNKALIFLDPYCPFCYSFAKGYEQLIKEVKSDIPIEFYSIFSQKEEVVKRGGIVSDCIVNGKPINVFLSPKEPFLREVKTALNIKE